MFNKGLMIFFAFSLVDILFTFAGIKAYGIDHELNPVVRYIWSVSPLFYPVVAAIMFSLIISLLKRVHKTNPIYAWTSLMLTLLVTGIAVAGHVYGGFVV